MENPSSPLDTLRQLKEMLDAGALTPAEFEALKQRLVFTPAAPAPPAAAPAAANAPVASEQLAASILPVSEVPPSTVPPVAPLPFEELSSSPPVAIGHEPPFQPEAGTLFLTEESPVLPTPLPVQEHDLPAEPGAPAEPNSSLGLVLAIAGVLVFLAVVAYLGFTRPASEHIASTSQTAADSVATTIETGPQVAPLPATTAAPETVRVAPSHPAPVIQPRPTAPVADSATPAANLPLPDSAGNQ